MERHVERIDGIATRLHRLTDGELAGYLLHAETRRQRAEHDIAEIQKEQSSRGYTVEVALGQLSLVEPSPDLPPPDAA